MTTATAQSIAGDLEDIRTALSGRQAPFFSSLLARARVIATTTVERAGVDSRTWIYINPEFWGKLDFLGKAYISCHEVCFVPGTPILTLEHGFKPIEKVTPDEHVYCRRGSFTKVVKVFERKYDGNVIEITPRCGEKVVLTPNHPVLSIRGRYKRNTGFTKSLLRIDCHHPFDKSKLKRITPSFSPAAHLAKGDGLTIPLPHSQRVLKNETLPGYTIRKHYERKHVKVDQDVAYFLGWFLADGSLEKTKNTAVWFKQNKEKKSERVISIAAALNNDVSRLLQTIREKLHRSPTVVYPKDANVKRIIFSSLSLARFLQKHCYDGRDKKIPRWMLTAPTEIVKEFVNGLVAGDGYKNPNGEITLTSVSPGIYSFLPLLLLRLGEQPSISNIPKSDMIYKTKDGKSKKCTRRAAKKVVWYNKQKRFKSVIVGGRWYTPIKKIEQKYYSGFVYNLQTNEGTYTVPFFVVHNCHAAGWHPLRERSRVDPNKNPEDHETFNCAGDAIVFEMLKSLIRCPPIEQNCITPEWVAKNTDNTPIDEIERMTVEEVFDILKKHGKRGKTKIIADLIMGRGPKGTVVQEGHPAIGKGAPDQIKEAWKDFVSRAHMTQRMAGTVPVGIERFVNELIKPKIDPRSLIRHAIRVGMGKMVVSDWKRKSRRYPGALPGIKRLTVPTVWNLIDASGSIGGDEIKLALGTVYEFSRHAKVVAISFDTEAYDVATGNRPSDVITKMVGKIRGGGGTQIQKALERTLQRMRYKDVVLVITDGEIFDIETGPVQQLLAQIAHRASVCAFLTVAKENIVPQWRSIKLTAR